MIKPDPTCSLIADCVHGADAIIEKIVDWRPYDSLLTTIEFEPTAEGTTVHYRFAQPKKAKDRQALQDLGPQLDGALKAALAELATTAGADVQPIDFSA